MLIELISIWRNLTSNNVCIEGSSSEIESSHLPYHEDTLGHKGWSCEMKHMAKSKTASMTKRARSLFNRGRQQRTWFSFWPGSEGYDLTLRIPTWRPIKKANRRSWFCVFKTYWDRHIQLKMGSDTARPSSFVFHVCFDTMPWNLCILRSLIRIRYGKERGFDMTCGYNVAPLLWDVTPLLWPVCYDLLWEYGSLLWLCILWIMKTRQIKDKTDLIRRKAEEKCSTKDLYIFMLRVSI